MRPRRSSRRRSGAPRGAQAGELAAASALKAEEERGPQREAAAAKVRDLFKLGETVERWRAANAELSAADAAHVEALEVLSRAKAAREAAVADAEQVKQRIVAAEQAAAELKSAEQARVEARRVAALCGERDAAVEALGSAEAERAVAEAAFQDALALFTTLQTKFVELEASARAGRAAAIARELVTGEPCPVCGSTSHPAPAHGDDDLVDEAALDEAHAGLEAARDAKDRAKQQLGDAETKVAAARARADGLRRQVADDLTAVQALQTADACAATCEALAKTVAAAADPAELLASGRERLEAAERRVSDGDKIERAAAGRVSEKRGRATELGAAIPEDLRVPGALEGAVQAAAAERDGLAAALEAAQKANALAREALVRAQSDLDAAAAREKRERATEGEARTAFSKSLALQGFESPEAFQAAVMPEEHLTAAEVRIDTHAELLTAAKATLLKARGDADDHPASTPLADAGRRAAEARDASQTAQQALLNAERDVADLELARRELDDIDRRAAGIEASFAVAGRLADVAAGQSGGGKVCVPAVGPRRGTSRTSSPRPAIACAKMSRPVASRLVRQREATDLRRASGLDLAVKDTWYDHSSGPRSRCRAARASSPRCHWPWAWPRRSRCDNGRREPRDHLRRRGVRRPRPKTRSRRPLDALVRAAATPAASSASSAHVPELQQVIEARLEVKGGPAGSHTEFVVPGV